MTYEVNFKINTQPINNNNNNNKTYYYRQPYLHHFQTSQKPLHSVLTVN